METDRVFITDVDSIKAFIHSQQEKEDYFNYVMDRIISKRKA